MNFVKTRPNIEAMTTDELVHFLNEPRKCTGCGIEKLNFDFSITTERGKKVARSRCKVCMAKYYQTVADRKKHGPPKQGQLSKRDRDNKRTAVKAKAKVTFSVVRDSLGSAVIWRVLRSFNGCKPKQVDFFIHEQSAEAEAKRLNELFNPTQGE
jgi:hypothetical protein